MIIVKCKRDTGNRLAPAISDPLIATQSMAQARGKRYLDDPEQGGYYKTYQYNLTLPYSADIWPGAIVSVTCAKLGLTDANMKVRSMKITGSQSSLFASVLAERYTEP